MSDPKSKVYDYQRWQLPSLDKTAGNDDGLPAISRRELQGLEEQARAKGFEIGKWEGLEAGKAEAEQRAQQLAAILEAAAKPLADLDQQVARELAGLAMTIAGFLVKKELSVAPEAVLGVVEDAMAALPPQFDAAEQKISVLLHPEDLALVTEMITEQPDKQGWQLVASPEITRGGCQISTPDSFIDASLEKRSEIILASLLDAYQNHAEQQAEEP